MVSKLRSDKCQNNRPPAGSWGCECEWGPSVLWSNGPHRPLTAFASKG